MVVYVEEGGGGVFVGVGEYRFGVYVIGVGVVGEE